MDDEDDRHLAEWVRSLGDGATITWWSDHFGLDHAFTIGWADLATDALPEYNWCWTLVPPDDPDGDLPWPPDLMVYCLGDENGADDEDLSLVVAHAGLLTLEQALEMNDRSAGRSGSCWWGFAGWSANEASVAIEHWAASHGVSVHAEWDFMHAPSDRLRRAAQAAEAIRSGEEESYLLAPRTEDREFEIRATPGVLDVLLEAFLHQTPKDPDAEG